MSFDVSMIFWSSSMSRPRGLTAGICYRAGLVDVPLAGNQNQDRDEEIDSGAPVVPDVDRPSEFFHQLLIRFLDDRAEPVGDLVPHGAYGVPHSFEYRTHDLHQRWRNATRNSLKYPE